MTSNKKDLVDFGSSTKPHGIKGAFTFILNNESDSILRDSFPIYLFPMNRSSSISDEGELHIIEKVSFGNKVIVYLKDINDRNIVEKMQPFLIKVLRSDYPDNDDGELYLNDLIGLKVIENSTGIEIGFIENFYDNSVQIILVLSTGSEIPFVDHFVPSVDIQNGTINVVIPEII